jgi:dolichyl-phosphate-mannose--protein O-mannosyl transferase
MALLAQSDREVRLRVVMVLVKWAIHYLPLISVVAEP